MQASAKVLLAMYAKRQVTGASSPTFGHKDTFGKEVDDGLENKVTIKLREGGGWEAGPKMWDLPAEGTLPPGALAYVRAKAATICRAGRDLEFHQLADAVHLSGETAAWLERVAQERGVAPPPVSPTRGVWGPDGLFHTAGVALTDWWVSKSNRARRNFLRARGRAVQMGPHGLYRYFSA